MKFTEQNYTMGFQLTELSALFRKLIRKKNDNVEFSTIIVRQ